MYYFIKVDYIQLLFSFLKFLFAGRFFAGVGVGMYTMIIPLYQAELIHSKHRGRAQVSNNSPWEMIR